MGKPSSINPSARRRLRRVVALVLFLAALLTSRAQSSSSTKAGTVPLMLPAGIAYDTQGNLFVAASTAHQILRITPDGTLTTYAGTGEQGFSGDGGPATAARLDSPTGLAIAPSGDLYLADTHNHIVRRISARTGIITTIAGTGIPGNSASGTVATAAKIHDPTFLALDPALNVFLADSQNHLIRRIDALSGLLTTVAGTGVQGYSGDGGPALAATLDTPTGLAVNAAGNLFLADSHNHRIRRIEAATGIIDTVAGTGQPGFGGDRSAATLAQLHLPQGIVLDSAGNLLVADRANHRIRRIDASTGQITTVAGDGTQTFAGDGAPAATASLDSPTSLALSPASLATLSDTANLRIRQIDAATDIHTIAGIGTSAPGTLTLSGPSTFDYGSGTVTANLLTSPATGTVTFFDVTSASPTTLSSAPLTANAAVLTEAMLQAGRHQLSATYAGDPTHPSAQSPVFSVQIDPLTLTVSPASLSTLYGQPIPALTAQSTGLLAQDASAVTLNLSSPATAFSPPGTYPIAAVLAGSSAVDYVLTQTPASVTIGKAPSALSLSAALTLTAQATSSTSGTPTGSVTLMDGSAPIATALLNNAGIAAFATPTLATGTHTLIATYAGDQDFLSSTSAPTQLTVAPVSTADFTLAATGQTSLTIPSGTAATFSFAVTPTNGALSSPIQLTVSGLPTGATATFNPAYLPPSLTNTAFLLTIQTVKLTSDNSWHLNSGGLAWALILPLCLLAKRRSRAILVSLVAISLLTLSACGDRINQAASSATSRSYNLTILATATSANGTILQHTANVILILQ